MFTKSSLGSLVAFALSSAIGISGCNVDGRRQSFRPGSEHEGAVARAARADAEGEAVDLSVAEAEEVDLVEDLVAARTRYHEGLRQLQSYYESRGYPSKAKWAAFELEGLRGVQRFRYLLDAEIPSDALRAVDQIEEADALYEQGLDLMRRGGHGVPAVYRRDRMIEAARVFRELVEQYPTSDKIDDAAFFCGEIHKEYLPGQALLAAKWYERAWTWNPDTPHPARFEAAVVYDYRLQDRDRALELYQSVVEDETAIKSNVRFAGRRIRELTGAGSSGRSTTKP